MSFSVMEQTFTPKDLLSMPDGDHFELVDGKLVGRNMGMLAGWVASTINMLIRNHCQGREVGEVFSSDIGYRCFPDAPGKVRRPDGTFIRSERLPADAWQRGYCPVAPDLAIEVLSPIDLAIEVEQKIEEYRSAGVPLIWVVSPEARTVQVHRPDGSGARLRSDDELSGEDVLPGFSCAVRDLFPPESAAPPVETPTAP